MFIDQSPPLALSSAPAPQSSDRACAGLKLPEDVISAGGLYIGETHGTQESPRIALCVVNQTLETHKGPIVVVLELPDAAADLNSPFWAGDPDRKDGRSSAAMADLVLRLQALSRSHDNLKLVYMDNCAEPANLKPEDSQGYRDACMGRTLEAQSHNGYLIAYSGSYHNLRKAPDGYWPAGHFLPATIKTASIVAIDGGTNWNFGVKTMLPFRATPNTVPGFAPDPSHDYDYRIFIAAYSASLPYRPNGPDIASMLSNANASVSGATAVRVDRCEMPPALANAPGIVFGAPQGTNEAPAVFTCLVKAALKSRQGPVTVALNMSESARDIAYWTNMQNPGRNSSALMTQWLELAALARTEPRLRFDFQEACFFVTLPADIMAAVQKCYGDHLAAVARKGFFIAQRDLDFSYRTYPATMTYTFKPMAAYLDPAVKTIRFEMGSRTGFYQPGDHEFDYAYGVSATTPSARPTVQPMVDTGPDEPPINGITLQDLGIEGLISQRQANEIFTYADRSNAVREAYRQAQNQPKSALRDEKLTTIARSMDEIDEGVHPALTALITHGFWSRPGLRNAAFDTGVWLALQHIFDQALVDITLVQTAPLVKSGKFSGEAWAMMYDRNEIAHNRPQKFGTQMTCKAGARVPYDLVDPVHVEDFRKAYGFTQKLEDYQATFKGDAC